MNSLQYQQQKLILVLRRFYNNSTKYFFSHTGNHVFIINVNGEAIYRALIFYQINIWCYLNKVFRLYLLMSPRCLTTIYICNTCTCRSYDITFRINLYMHVQWHCILLLFRNIYFIENYTILI